MDTVKKICKKFGISITPKILNLFVPNSIMYCIYLESILDEFINELHTSYSRLTGRHKIKPSLNFNHENAQNTEPILT